MPVVKYRCTNLAGGCIKALVREVIEISEGQEAICPNSDCGWKLEAISLGVRFPKWIYAAAAAVIVVIGLSIWVAMPSPIKPKPDAAQKMLSDFYPQLPAK
jgi:hypothetical protein